MPPKRQPAARVLRAIPIQDRPFDLEAYLPFELIAAASRVAAALNAACLAPHRLSLAEWRVISLAGLHDGISATEISRRASLDKVKVSRAVASLATRGLLRQAQNADDARARRLHITRRGRTLLERLTPPVRAFEASLAQALSASDVTVLRAALARLSVD